MNPDGAWGRVTSRYREYTQVMSPPLIKELLRVARQPRLTKRFGPGGQQAAIDRVLEIADRAHVVTPVTTPPVCRDANDDIFFACAVAGRADYIVSEDEDVLAVAEYEGVRTIRTAAFLRLLDEAAR